MTMRMTIMMMKIMMLVRIMLLIMTVMMRTVHPADADRSEWVAERSGETRGWEACDGRSVLSWHVVTGGVV